MAATGSGAGKTTITCGILAALKENGLNPSSFKCGPDYIDPMFHRNVIGIESGNLDTFFTDHETTLNIFSKEYSGDIAVIEGVMGLYDGIGGTGLKGSTYDLALALKAPVILIIDARGKGRSILAEIKGFLDYDTDNLIKGIILNRISNGFAQCISNLIEEELSVPVIGSIENDEDVSLDSRHLGLIMPEEIHEIKSKLDICKKNVLEGLDLGKFLEIANSATVLNVADHINIVNTNHFRLAIARDEAFCFYYKENIEVLREAGIELVEFSPIHDKKLPDNISGLLLGGGYPENYLKELESNIEIRVEIQKAYAQGLPILAECGGFMYMLDSISNRDGNSYQMVGALPGKAFWTGKLVRFGYVTIEDDKGLSIKGHEFHYYDTDNNGENLLAKKPTGNRSWKCMHQVNGGFLGFPHLYYPSEPEFVSRFVEAMKSYGKY